jgi:hypothetical protein
MPDRAPHVGVDGSLAPRRVPLPIVVAGIVAALVVGFGAGRLTVDGGGTSPRTAETATPDPGIAASVPASSARPSPSPTPATAPLSLRYGVVAHLMWTDTSSAIRLLDEVAGAGLGVIRFDVSWRNLEPRPGTTEDLEDLDAVMGAIRDRGMRPIVTVIETPSWANGDRGRFTPPDDPNTYARFVAALAARYADVPGIAWEIWNEPNDPRFWQPEPDPVAYTRLLTRASAAIRAAAPDATVLGGSILYGDAEFLDGMYDAGALGAFDGLAVHPYAQNRAPADTGDPYHSFAGGLERIREVMVRRGDAGTSMWITEAGWTEADGVDEATRGRYFAEAVEMVEGREDVEVFAAYVYGPAAERGYDLAVQGPGAETFARYRDAVRAAADPVE